MHIIVTKAGVPILVDDEDRALVETFQWHAVRVGKRGKFYAYTDSGGQRISMHRLLLGLSKGDPLQVDHLNGCSLDNRRSNPRIVTSLENAWNIVFHRHNSTGFAGVSFNRRLNRYQARIRLGDKRVSLGYFDTPEAASEAYSRAHHQRNIKHV